MINPIVIFSFYFGLAITVILSDTWTGICLLFTLTIILLLLNKKHTALVFKQIKPFILFLPLFISIYIIMSLFFTNSSGMRILNEATTAIIKLLLLVTIMSVYIVTSKDHNLILALRSIWSKSKIPWKWVDDMFIFLELTLRFYPSFQREWDTLNRSKIALGLDNSLSRWNKVKAIANDLPGIIVQSYNRAENTASVMIQRGYGSIIPRGVAQPIVFRIADLVFLILIVSFIFLINHYGTL